MMTSFVLGLKNGVLPVNAILAVVASRCASFSNRSFEAGRRIWSSTSVHCFPPGLISVTRIKCTPNWVTTGWLIWPTFFLVDFMAARLVQPSAMWWLFGLRAATWAAVTPAMLRLRRAPLPSRRMLAFCDAQVFGTGSLAIALMCAGFGGLDSVYGPGFCVALVARNSFVANPLKRSLLPVAIMTLTFPVLGRARERLWLVTGVGKAAALRDLLEQRGSSPAVRLPAVDSSVFCDEAAARGGG